MKNRKILLWFSLAVLLSFTGLPLRQTLLAKEEPLVVQSEPSPTTEQSLIESQTPNSTQPPVISQSSEPQMSTTNTSASETMNSTPTSESSTVISESTTSTVTSSSQEKLEASESFTATAPAQTIAASTSVIQSPATKQEVEENYQFSVTKNQTTQEFIDTIGEDAQTIAWKEELYASVMIAQAILETGSGNSQLARPPHHNLFGIKGSYQGKQVNFATQEDNGSGQLYTIQSSFRQYPSYKESLEDYAALLKKGTSGNSTFYQGVWKESAKTYQEATKALTGKYATDTQYDKKLNALIETYQLTDYDQDPAKMKKAKGSKANEKKSTKSSTKESDTTASTTADQTAEEVLREETVQGVTRLLPIPQRPAKQIPGRLTTQ